MPKKSKKYLHLAIDAHNIREGGGVTHLSQLLTAGNPLSAGFDKVTVWTSKAIADTLPDRPWLQKRCSVWTESNLLGRLIGQKLFLPKELLSSGCDVLFSPGGTLPKKCGLPMVTMSQNMLPFEPLEAVRFGRFSLMRLKMYLLRYFQKKSFRNSSGLIFLTDYAARVVTKALGGINCQTACIPHGIEDRFRQKPRPQRLLEDCSIKDPFRLLYVSILMPYKHQLEVANAVSELRANGFPIQIRFVGASRGSYGLLFIKLIKKLDPSGEFLKWTGHEPFENLHNFYEESDCFIFASSCENLPNILIEAMASGLPIASALKGPMPEVLGDAGIYFDPDSSGNIADTLQKLTNNVSLRIELAQKGWIKAQDYSWDRCAKDTFEFIAQVALRYKEVNNV